MIYDIMKDYYDNALFPNKCVVCGTQTQKCFPVPGGNEPVCDDIYCWYRWVQKKKDVVGRWIVNELLDNFKYMVDKYRRKND